MDSGKKIQSLLKELEENTEALKEALGPLLTTRLKDITSELPLLERAKLNTMVAYSIESLIFSALKINGVDAKQHPVFNELARVKSYFQKIEDAEKASTAASEKREATLDKPAAGRMINHALAGNDKYDADRAHQQVRQKAMATQKLKVFEEKLAAEKAKAGSSGAGDGKSKKKRKADALDEQAEVPTSVDEDNDDDGGKDGDESKEQPGAAGEEEEAPESKSSKKKRKDKDRKRKKHEKSHKPPRSAKDVFKDLIGRKKKE